MPAEYNIWLGHAAKVTYNWQALCENVAQLFVPVIKKHKDFDRIRVRSTKVKPSLLPHELLVYVVPKPIHGVIAHRFGSEGNADLHGYTQWEGALTGAEVYVRDLEPEYLAKFVFHEALHAKAHQGAELHKGDGLAALGREAVNYEDAELSETDIKLMTDNLKKTHTPWTGGFVHLEKFGEKIKLDEDDPLEGL